ncbi:PilN domain-containing protein [Desulfosoma caldarium]|uniref:Type IV pilus assembly protein PilN n=1 Tax=Desulfosoma caldarium TaxID=610254 RepID=A0A3N1VPT0_9BACT|nr:PilN domain-containing protein [Desulfosoma caldarium]ROR03048.1 type IV pilus assembly protein PilN [Desulfosoma caldarium]
MIRINLLPAEKKPIRTTARQYLIGYVLCVVVTGLAIAFLWSNQTRTIETLQRRESELKAEAAKYAKYEKILQDLTKQKEIIEKKKEIIQGLEKDRDRMARVLALLSLWVPVDKVWFETVTITGDKVDVAGIALSNESVAEFMRNLEESPFVMRGSVVLAHSRQTSVGQRKLREYRLTWRMVPYSRVKESLAHKDKGQGSEEAQKPSPQTTFQAKPQG